MKEHFHIKLPNTWRLGRIFLLLTMALPFQFVLAQDNNPVAEKVKINAKGLGAFGGDIEIHAQVYKPTGDGPFPVVLYSHGRSGDRVERANLKNPVLLGHVKYWLAKGYTVVAPMRVGYGETGGTDREGSGSRYDANGVCTNNRPEPSNTAKNAVASTLPVLEWVRVQTWVNKDRILLEGQSVGGLTTVALCSQNPPGVIGCINFAGGAGGDPNSKGKMCAPEILGQMMTDYGKTTKLPNIWLYAENDQYWGPDSPKQWHKNFAEGGSPTQFVATPGLPDADGHLLLRVGGRLWSQPLNAWLKKNNF